MPIRINLLAEQQATEEMRRRDPVKRAAFIAIGLVAVVLLWGVFAFIQERGAAGQLQEQDAKLDKLKKEYSLATTNLARTAEIQGKLTALTRLVTNRVVWGSALDALQRCAINNIQVTKIHVTQTYEDKPGDLKKKTLTSAREKIVVTIEARDYGRAEEQNYNKFKERVLSEPFFKEHLPSDAAASVRVGGFTQPLVDKDDVTKTYIGFWLECSFQEKVREK
jgi:hypothetical protein